MRKIYTLLTVITISAFIYSCQQEVFEIPLEGCRVIKAHYYGGGGMHDSANFDYDEQGRLIKWTNMDGYYTYHYQGTNIIARVYRENSGPIWYVDSVYYNPDNTIASIVFYDYSDTYSPDTLHNKVNFHYQGGRVVDLENIEYFDYGFGPETDTTFITLTWSAGNIVKMRWVNNGYIGFDDSVLYRYDANPNYFKPIHPHFFLFDPQFELQVGFETQLAYFYSQNNVSNFNVYGTWDYPVVYGLDSTNNVTKVDMGGFPYMEYEYECNNP